jgi:hypothetical protein
MKKLLLTTALASALISGVSAVNAETKVSGNLGISYYGAANNKSAATTGSWNGFGTESQINISNSGDLNNGMKYRAGFSWEIDGGQTLAGMDGSNKASTEGTYIEFISGGTTIGLSADRSPTTDGTGSDFVGWGYRTTSVYTSIGNNTYNTPNADFGFNIQQKMGDNNLSFLYVPNSGLRAGTDVNDAGGKAAYDGGESAYEIVYTGKIAGADLKAGINRTKGASGTFSDKTGQAVSIAYPIGKLKVGYTHGKTESSVVQGSTSVTNTTDEVGIGYAVSDSVSIGATYTNTDGSAVTTDEKMYTVALGYNLGAVSVGLQYKNNIDVGGTSGQDVQQIGMYVGTKF